MSSKIKSLSHIKTADKNKKPQLLQKDFRNIECNNNIENNSIKALKRKIDAITKYQKSYISIINLIIMTTMGNFSLINSSQ